jgi:DNA-binding NtrC family response regulator
VPRILIVEDEADVRFVVEHVLLDAGYEVDTTGTMQGGLDLLGCRSYDLVVADGKLPDGTGLDIADAAGERGTGTLVMTGYAFTLPRDAPAQYEILLKPLRPREIIDAVERALRE